ncbi:MAG: hypothetical protein CMH54_07580 [Myxococcales bacterium]|nr:hypothetical protein [Myxococcales bacterium]
MSDLAHDVKGTRNPKVYLSMLGPAVRGFILKVAKKNPELTMRTRGDAHFKWDYRSDRPELRRLYDIAKTSQWNAETDLDWSIDVDPHNTEHDLFPEQYLPLVEFQGYKKLTKKEREIQRYDLMAWLLSQFLHGEQGALFAACQVTNSVGWMDGKLYGSTQVVDEGRHVEVFGRYLNEKLEKLYDINDNLYVIIDALMRDGRWDMKFLGMQIMIEGLALGAFGTMRMVTREPLLKELLKYVIMDEARHVHYGVLALRTHYQENLSEKERREREDWAFEVSVLLRNRFLAHEFYEEHWAHTMNRKEWDALVLGSPFMKFFRSTLFKRIVPNLRRINLLSDRIRPHYEKLGLLEWENEKAAPEVSIDELLGGS